MMAAWRVAVLFNSTLTGSGFTQLTTQATASEAAIARVRASMFALKATALGALTAIGAGMIEHGVVAAAKLQQAMTAVGIATGTAGQQLEYLRGVVMRTSMATAQDPVTISQEMAMAARSGINRPAMLASLFPEIAKFADVQYLLPQHADPVDSVKRVVQFAHYFKAYDQKRMALMIDQMNRAMNVQPEDASRMVAQGKYFIPLATSLGVSIPDLMGYIALMGQTGFLLGKGGAGFQRVLLGAINATTLTSHLSAARASGLLDLGMVRDGRFTYLDKKGNLEFSKLMSVLQAARSHETPTQFARDTYNVFGTQGQQFLMAIMDPAAQQQYARIKKAMHDQQTVEQQQARLMATVLGSWQQFTTNFNAIAINVFYPMLPKLGALFGDLANRFASVANYLFAHPDLGMFLAKSAFAAVATTGAAAAVSLWQTVAALRAIAVSPLIRGVGGLGSVGGTAAAVVATRAATAIPVLGWGLAGAIALDTMFPNRTGRTPGLRAPVGSSGWQPVHITVNTTTTDPRKHAELIIQHIARRIPFALRAGAGSVGHPRLSAASGAGAF